MHKATVSPNHLNFQGHTLDNQDGSYSIVNQMLKAGCFVDDRSFDRTVHLLNRRSLPLLEVGNLVVGIHHCFDDYPHTYPYPLASECFHMLKLALIAHAGYFGPNPSKIDREEWPVVNNFRECVEWYALIERSALEIIFDLRIKDDPIALKILDLICCCKNNESIDLKQLLKIKV